MKVEVFENEQSNEMDDGYESAEVDKDGNLRCYCGAELTVEDEESGVYRCTDGGPLFKFDDGSVKIDKFGNMFIKKGGEHGQ